MSSPYFQQIFLSTTGNDPVIVLAEVNPSHLEKILEYIYNGETSLEYNEFQIITKIAKQLKIKHFPSIESEVFENEYLNENETNSTVSPVSPLSSTLSEYSISLDANDQEKFHSNNTRCRSPGVGISEFGKLINEPLHKKIKTENSQSESKNVSEPETPLEMESNICLPNQIRISWHAPKISESSSSPKPKSTYNKSEKCNEKSVSDSSFSELVRNIHS